MEQSVAETTRPLLDKLGVKPGAKVALVDIDDAWFVKLLRERTSDIGVGKPKTPCDLVFMAADERRDLDRLKQVKSWIEPNGAIWVVRLKGGQGSLKDTDLIDAGLSRCRFDAIDQLRHLTFERIGHDKDSTRPKNVRYAELVAVGPIGQKSSGNELREY